MVTFATMLHQWSRNQQVEHLWNPMTSLHEDEYVRSRARSGEFIEANRELAKSGFEHVGGEYQLSDDAMQHRFIKNEWITFSMQDKFLSERWENNSPRCVLYASENLAAASPFKVLTDTDRARYSIKADMYTANMSRHLLVLSIVAFESSNAVSYLPSKDG